MKRSSRVLLTCLLLVCALISPSLADGAAKTEADVRAVVTTWVHSVTAQARPDALVTAVEPYQVDGRTVAFIAHLSGGGFCLCGADDVTLPVYFYNPTGTYDPQNPEYQFILEEIAGRHASILKAQSENAPAIMKYQDALSERARQWRDLAAGITGSAKCVVSKPLAEPVMMEIYMKPQWHQGSPYNDLCPVLTPGSDEHCVVGCVATAMAQIMYYWKWPANGMGSNGVWYRYRWRTGWDSQSLPADPSIPTGWAGGNRLQWTPANGGLLQMNGYWDQSLYGGARNINKTNTAFVNALTALWNRLTRDSTWYSASFASSAYDWSVLHDIHTDPVDDGDGELAKINFHAGLAVNMAYGIGASGSDTGPLRNGFVNYMRYESDAWFCPKDENLVAEEITWLRPVAYGGYSTDGGHEWVISGYNRQTSPWQFKMILGWGPGSTGWYMTDSVGFTIGQDQVMRIAPTGVAKFVGGSDEFPDGRPSHPFNNIEQALAGAPNATMLIFKAGGEYTFAASELVINRPIVLKGKDVTIRK